MKMNTRKIFNVVEVVGVVASVASCIGLICVNLKATSHTKEKIISNRSDSAKDIIRDYSLKRSKATEVKMAEAAKKVDPVVSINEVKDLLSGTTEKTTEILGNLETSGTEFISLSNLEEDFKDIPESFEKIKKKKPSWVSDAVLKARTPEEDEIIRDFEAAENAYKSLLGKEQYELNNQDVIENYILDGKLKPEVYLALGLIPMVVVNILSAIVGVKIVKRYLYYKSL